jgi:hypothetical protein
LSVCLLVCLPCLAGAAVPFEPGAAMPENELGLPLQSHRRECWQAKGRVGEREQAVTGWRGRKGGNKFGKCPRTPHLADKALKPSFNHHRDRARPPTAIVQVLAANTRPL